MYIAFSVRRSPIPIQSFQRKRTEAIKKHSQLVSAERALVTTAILISPLHSIDVLACAALRPLTSASEVCLTATTVSSRNGIFIAISRKIREGLRKAFVRVACDMRKKYGNFYESKSATRVNRERINSFRLVCISS